MQESKWHLPLAYTHVNKYAHQYKRVQHTHMHTHYKVKRQFVEW